MTPSHSQLRKTSQKNMFSLLSWAVILMLMARYVFLCLFLTEMLVRMYALGPRIYFESSFNRFGLHRLQKAMTRYKNRNRFWWHPLQKEMSGCGNLIVTHIRFDCVVICASVFEMVYTCLRWDTYCNIIAFSSTKILWNFFFNKNNMELFLQRKSYETFLHVFLVNVFGMTYIFVIARANHWYRIIKARRYILTSGICTLMIIKQKKSKFKVCHRVSIWQLR